MKSTIEFVIHEPMADALKGAGVRMTGESVDACPLHVGDVISSADAPSLYFRITGRLFHFAGRGKRSTWFLTLEPADDPFVALDAKALPRPA